MRKKSTAFLLGFTALSFQVLLMREFTVHFYGNEITFGCVLAFWLLWGGLGSLTASRIKDDAPRLFRTFFAVILVFPLCLAGLRMSRFLLNTLPGEVTGLAPALLFAAVLCLFISFPLGRLFVLTALHLNRDPVEVYLLESLGAAAGGLGIYFLAVPHLSNWQASSVLGMGLAFAVFFLSTGQKPVLLLAVSLFVWAAVFAADIPSQRLYWKPFHLAVTRDTPYGKLQVITTAEQVSLYDNSLLVYSHPDPASAEESVHFAFLQNPAAERALLIGGGAGGGLVEVLKYPGVSVDYVELDPEIIRLSESYLPESERRALRDPRVTLHVQDGKAYLNRTDAVYDIIILNLPEPATAQINRFYTLEFFRLARARLSARGLLAFRVPSAENYISPELQSFLGSLYHTLRLVFPAVEIVPGSTNIFLASTQLRPLDATALSRTIAALSLETTFVSPALLPSRLDPLRVEQLRRSVTSAPQVLNRDSTPISYFYDSVLWSKQFGGLEAKLFSTFARLDTFWLLDLPLLAIILVFIVLSLLRVKPSVFLAPLAVMGLTTITVEIIVIIAFQTLYGYLYQKIALLFASFMIGLFAGALRGKLRRAWRLAHLILIQAGFILLLFLAHLGLRTSPSEPLFVAYLFVLGYLGGDLFVVSTHLYLQVKKHYGLGYGLDLMGSFAGALVASTLLIPLVGLPLLLRTILLLNSFCLLFLIWGLKSRL